MNYINFKKSIAVLVVLLFTFSCTKFEELTDDPNKATKVPPSQLLAEVLSYMTSGEGPWSEAHRDNQFWVISFDYYGDQDYNWGTANYRYNVLSNIVAMEKEAMGLDNQEKYLAIAKFLKAYYYDYMTKRVGDIPMSQALQANADPAISKPIYDKQIDVYTEILKLLEAANDQMIVARGQVGTSDIGGDFIYRSDMEKWQKAINAFHLRVLISLSKKNADLGIANKINTILTNPTKYPLFTGIGDNMMRTYADELNNRYSINPSNRGFYRNRYLMGATYMNLLKANNDPRIYKVADPAPLYYDANDPLNLNAYIGANTGDAQGQMQADSDAGKYSYPNDLRYYSTYEGEPYTIIGYAEQEFNIAEAINRGWVTGDAATHYTNGISGSMAFYGVSQADINTFLANPNVVYKGNNSDGLNQILTQKYIAFFNNSGYEAYFNYRRTGVPTFDVGPANVNGAIPKRWKYPTSEFENNNANVNAALSSQYGGSDNINGTMWIIN